MFQRTTAINKILALSKRVRIIQGGTSASKTYGIIAILIEMCLKRKGLEVSVVAESIPHLKRGALKDFLKIMQETGRFNPDNYNISDRKYKFANGSYIEFFSSDMENSVGARRNILYINEANHACDFPVYHQMAVRTSDIIFIDYNPANEFWVQTELEGDPDAEKLILTYKDNEALSSSIIAEIEKARDRADESEYWANWWKVYGLGQQGTVAGIVFEKFKQVLEFPKECKWTCYGLDYGYTNDPTALIKVGLYAGELYLEQMIYRTGLTNADIFNLVTPFNIKRTEIVADSAEPKSNAELRQRGLNVIGAAKGADSVLNGINLIKQYPVNITSGSLDLIKEWRIYSWKCDRSVNKYLNEPEDINNHAIDAVRYAVAYKLGNPSIGQYRIGIIDRLK